MEEALQSIARAFARNREATPLLEVAILVLLAAAVALQLAALGRGWWRRRSAFREQAERHGLSPAERATVEGLARLVEARPVDVLDHLDLFERATARALAEWPPGAPPAGAGGGATTGEPAADLPTRLRRVRHALGFDRLPPHAPLLSTRELMPGTAVEVEGQPGQASDVDEAAFSVEVGRPPALAVGATATLGLVHAREARYALRCRLLVAEQPRPGRWRLAFAHDEAPVRIQQREYARVPAHGPITLRPVAAWPGRPALQRELRAELVDVSGGGALVSCAAALPVGQLVGASFPVGDAAFGNLRAVVLASARAPDGRWRVHLEFGHLPEAERDRLVAAVERLEVAAARARVGA